MATKTKDGSAKTFPRTALIFVAAQPSAEDIREAVTTIRSRTDGVRVGQEVRIGKDSTEEEAVWVYVVVPDERIEDFYKEWDQLRDQIRERVREKLGRPDAFVYIRMRAASEVKDLIRGRS